MGARRQRETETGRGDRNGCWKKIAGRKRRRKRARGGIVRDAIMRMQNKRMEREIK